MDRKADYLAILATGTSLAKWNPGGAEYALTRPVAIQAVRALADSSSSVLGGDVVEIADGGLQYIGNWYSERTRSESDASFAERSQAYAKQYIEEFRQTSEREPLFVLVVA